VDRLSARAAGHPQAPTNPQLFRLYGDFGGRERGPAADWMLAFGDEMVRRGLFKARPAQYRLCDWRGEHAAQFKWHTDSDRHGENILAIALTDGRGLGFRSRARKGATWRLNLDAGDAYMMRGAARWQWEHRILPVGPRRSGGRSLILAG